MNMKENAFILTAGMVMFWYFFNHIRGAHDTVKPLFKAFWGSAYSLGFVFAMTDYPFQSQQFQKSVCTHYLNRSHVSTQLKCVSPEKLMKITFTGGKREKSPSQNFETSSAPNCNHRSRIKVYRS